MNHYEKITILSAKLSEEETTLAIEKLTDMIIKEHGVIIKKENWGRRKLAYEINNHKEGTYVYIFFTAPPACIPSLEKFYRVFEPVVKFMVVKLNKHEIAAALAKLEKTEEETTAETDEKPVSSLNNQEGQTSEPEEAAEEETEDVQ